MNPIEQLKDEHRAVRTAISILARMAGDMLPASADDMEELLLFLRIFVDHCHHSKEEKLLFPALEAVGVGRQGGPIGVMLAEHDQGRMAIRGMSVALNRFRRGEPGAASRFAENARIYRELLDRHIEKENTVLFVLAERYLSDRQKSELATGFSRIENQEIGTGRHLALHLMLDRLAERYLACRAPESIRPDGRAWGCPCGHRAR